jgi:serpin B
MCQAGSRKNTELQLKKVLNFKNLSNDEIHKANLELHDHLNSLGDQISLNIANKIFQRNSYKIHKEFIDLLKKFYKSDAQGLDFSNSAASAKVINDWVATQTNNKIQNLVPETVITDLTKLILVNAIYFKG